MINAGHDERDTGYAMHCPPNGIGDADPICERVKGTDEGKTGEDQDRKTTEQDQVLDPLICRHAHHGMVLELAPRDRLASPDHGIVQDHPADDRENDYQIKLFDPANDNASDARRDRC